MHAGGSASGKGDKRDGDQGEVDHHNLHNHQAVWYLLLILPFPLNPFPLLFLLLLLYDV